MIDVIYCLECGRPWGCILDRGVEPSDELQERCQTLMTEAWEEFARCDVDDDVQLDFASLPRVTSMHVVFITEATADFACDRLNCEVFVGSCWQNLDDVDLPAWLLKGRKQRWAYRWDCCEIGWTERYVRVMEAL